MSATFKQLVKDATDRAIEYGVLHKDQQSGVQETVVRLVPIALWPAVFPRTQYDFLLQVQMDYNLLVNKLRGSVLVTESLQCIVKHDDFIRRLVEVYNTIDWEKQPISICLQRCDYFLHVEDSETDGSKRVTPKLVEMNIFCPACAGSILNVDKVHRVLQVKYQDSEFMEHYKGEILNPDPISTISHAMALAWKEYGQPKAAILMVINENEWNVFDLGNFELKMTLEYQIPVVRHTFGELHDVATIKEDNGLLVDGFEIAIVYYRSGYDSSHFPTEKQWSAYLMLEQSKAIKCPPVSHYLCNFKRIQQVISNPNVLESLFDDSSTIERIRSTFVGQYSLDMGPEGDKAVEMALKTPEKFVLKTQTEAKKECYMDEALQEKLLQMQKLESRVTYTLMDRINYPTQEFVVVGSDSKHQLLQTSPEVGIYGVLVRNGENVLMNSSAGYLAKCLPTKSDEVTLINGALCTLILTPAS